MPYRQLSDNLRRTLNIMSYCKQHHIEALSASMYMEKAFDSVSIMYLKQVLYKMGFGENFMKAIFAIYLKPSAHLRINMFSDAIHLEKGTRQGCPLSPLLFALAVEPLASLIRSHENVSGIKIGNSEHKIGLHTDNIVLYLSNIKTSLYYTLTSFKEFANISGLKMNLTKLELYPIYLPIGL